MIFYSWSYYLLGVLLLPGIILSIIAQSRTTHNFNKYSKVNIRSIETASQIARRLLNNAGLEHIKIGSCSGHLTDHYNPKTKTIRLSHEVYNSTSISAIGVMAHEVGHAIQEKDGYIPIKIRSFLVPVIKFSSYFMWPLAILGVILEFMAYTEIGFIFICIGIGIFALSTLFALVTIPVERDASRRAYKLLWETGIINEEEGYGIKKVLNAAGSTYVAALITSILSLLRFVLFILSLRKD